MIKRNVLKDLEYWASKQNPKPLMLRGSRQVGKTTLIDIFSQGFQNYLCLNLEKSPSAVVLFEKEQEIDALLADIFLFCNKERKPGKILLFIDEIQNSETAILKLRYFYEAKLPDLYVVAAGSLLETVLNKQVSFPVGRLEYLAIRPCVFNEFLLAIGEKQLEKALQNYSIPEALHQKTINLFNTYTLIGGMPEVVSNYSKNKDYLKLNSIYESLLISFQDDVEKYARNSAMSNVIRYVLQYAWKFVAERIVLGGFAGSAYKAREMGEALRTLEKTFLLELSYPTTNTFAPIHKELKRSPKLLWLDTGLVNYAAGMQKEVFGSMDILDAWRGKIAEHIVAQEILALNNKVSNNRTFWVSSKNSSEAEVDFVLSFQGKIIPIEVKSGHNAKLRSLHTFMEMATHDIAVRVWSEPFSINEVKTIGGKKRFKLINLPFYYVGQLEKILNEYI